MPPLDFLRVLPITAIAAGAVVTLLACVSIVLTQKWHGKHTYDSVVGVQKFHSTPTPRVGGVAILCGLVVAWCLTPKTLSPILGCLLFAGLPALGFGLAEDLTKRVGVRERLLATMASGILAWWLTDISLTRLDIWGIDAVLAYLPVSVVFTAFAVAGVANAVNIVDGFNGLASGTVLICLTALGLIAYQVGDYNLTALICLIAGITAGFLVVNFPFGKIFLGDGGAYYLGFLLAWLAVMLPMRNPSISAWSSLLACGYPIIEVLFSMLRRFLTSNSPGEPDRLHLHSLIKARAITKWFPQLPLVIRNAAVSPILWLYACIPASAAVLFRSDTAALMGAFVFSVLIYVMGYFPLAQFRWKRTTSS